MIAKLSGLVDSVGEDWVIVDVSGVGYLVSCSNRTLSGLPGVGKPVSLLIDTHVREDHIHLYAPMVIFLILVRTRTTERPGVLAPLMLALIASVIPYTTRLVAVEHLYLLVLRERLSASAGAALVITLATAAAALAYWISSRPKAVG